ncbi:ABC transporter substrate-binding protein [Thalassolituus sp. LLYu03]|uniref:ABC transporter substrate-binding protein n=1 Tax=Thalassolituus sp. LLYu03 TaxID=3421656 RepID=UPI003D298FC2
MTIRIYCALLLACCVPRAAATDAVTFATNWYAQAEHGGFYQAQAEGIYERYGLDVTIRMGGPQVNGLQLLAAGQVDFLMGVPISSVHAVAEGLPVVSVAAIFQKDPLVIIAHPDVRSLDDIARQQQALFVSSSAYSSYFPWLKARYGFRDDMARPYSFSVMPFLKNPQSAQQGLLTSEPFAISQSGLMPQVFLMSDFGYPPYAETIETTHAMLNEKPDVVRRFVRASIEGWVSYLANPAAGNRLIVQDNPEMTEEQLYFGLEAMRTYGIVAGGDAVQGGIGVMTHERWQKLYDFLREASLLTQALDIHQVYSLDFLPASPLLADTFHQ